MLCWNQEAERVDPEVYSLVSALGLPKGRHWGRKCQQFKCSHPEDSHSRTLTEGAEIEP